MTAFHSAYCRASLALAILFAATGVMAQAPSGAGGGAASRDSLLMIAREIVDSSSCQVLVTVDEEGKPRSREMSPFPPEKDWVIWLGASPRSRKIRQIANNPNVVVYYYDQDRYGYVSISGTAAIVDDPGMKKVYWKQGWEGFFPDRDVDYVLIRVTPLTMEICSFSHGLFGDPDTMAPVSLEF